MQLTKMTVDRGLDADIQSLMVHGAPGRRRHAHSPRTPREGVTAFLEKREPKWIGR